ncbi:protein FAM216A [Myxocyprinus asiaticus]|uniref:protein FAM216A n=1 Tax=Myxocyprinus asiaticus TaxID=70543 RepID=UPI0022224B68|nr:protein FAM216A [Myxocyprinus asiaticus]
MKKHVKFLENNSDKSGLYHKTSFLPSRSSGLNHVDGDKTNPKFGHGMQRAVPVKVAEQNRDMKTIQIPKTMTAAPFLQHPGLTPGQKRFLYSIAEAYSTDQMRQLICQHYMNVLHRCIRTDLKVNVKQQKSIYTPEVEYITNPQTTTSKTKESGKRYLTAEKVKKTTFPKIIDHQRWENEHRVKILYNMRVIVKIMNCDPNIYDIECLQDCKNRLQYNQEQEE